MSINVIPNSTYKALANNAPAIKAVGTAPDNKSLISEIYFLNVLKYTNAVELDNRGENLSNVMVELFLRLPARELELKLILSKHCKKDEDQIDTATVTEFLNIELSNIKKEILSKYFPRPQIEIANFKPSDISKNSRMSFGMFLKQLKKTYDLIIEKTANHVSCFIIDPDFKLRYKDLKTKEIRTLTPKDNINCTRYAFYHVHEEKLEHWIFEETSMNPFASDGSNSDPKKLPRDLLMQKMKDLGYSLVTQARKDDIICYMDKKGLFTHMGAMYDENTVYSIGGSLPQLVLHPTRTIAKCYGSYYLLFRKEKADNNTVWFLDSSRFEATKKV